jgi:hypothetical protein
MVPELNVGGTRIYISFAGRDRARVMQLVRWLNDSGRQVGADDRHSFAAGDDWRRSAARRLKSCDVILCVITPGWLESDFCRFEFSYGAKQGKFILPVICEPADLRMLPPAMRALPSVDLTRNRLVDYLVLRDTLRQAGSNAASRPALHGERKHSFARALVDHRSLWLALGLALALTVIAIGAIWLWTSI